MGSPGPSIDPLYMVGAGRLSWAPVLRWGGPVWRPPLLTDRHLYKHYLPHPPHASGKYSNIELFWNINSSIKFNFGQFQLINFLKPIRYCRTWKTTFQVKRGHLRTHCWSTKSWGNFLHFSFQLVIPICYYSNRFPWYDYNCIIWSS